MNPAEVLTLTRIVKGACPAQQIDTYTPDIWAEILGGIQFGDARQAVIDLARRQPFIAASDIVTEVKRIRGARFDGIRYDQLGAAANPDDPAAYLQQTRADRRAIGDGRGLTEPATGPQRPVGELLGRLADHTQLPETSNA